MLKRALLLSVRLKGLNVTFRGCLLTVTPVADKSTAVSILLLSLCRLSQHRPKQ